MILLKIDNQDIKKFMQLLIKDDYFDKLIIRSVTINSFVEFNIETEKIIVNNDEASVDFGKSSVTFSTWAEVRPYVENMLKGKVKPKKMLLVFSLSNEKMEISLPEASAAFINIKFENGELTVISGLSLKTFSMAKTVEQKWDNFVQAFFKKKDLTFENIL